LAQIVDEEDSNMYGLTVRWSQADCGPDVVEALREYVTQTSMERFTDMPGLKFKTWRMRPGEWFEGTYVWDTPEAREAFAAAFSAAAASAPVSQMIGNPPALIETWEVVAVAEGGEGFTPGVGPRA
jgi:hypothetical protein